MKRFFLFGALTAAVLLAGCNTLERRIEQNAATFNSLDATAQEKLRKGIVELGYTSTMVYIALGAPDEKRDNLTKDGRSTDWIYNTYRHDYAGTAHVGYRRFVSFDPATKRRVVWIEPVYADVYRDRVEPRIRISFKDDRVSAIEQVKR